MGYMVAVKIMVPFWIPMIIRHLIFKYPKKDHNFDNHPYGGLGFKGFEAYIRRMYGCVGAYKVRGLELRDCLWFGVRAWPL